MTGTGAGRWPEGPEREGCGGHRGQAGADSLAVVPGGSVELLAMGLVACKWDDVSSALKPAVFTVARGGRGDSGNWRWRSHTHALHKWQTHTQKSGCPMVRVATDATAADPQFAGELALSWTELKLKLKGDLDVDNSSEHLAGHSLDISRLNEESVPVCC